jgi:LysM repeat protein
MSKRTALTLFAVLAIALTACTRPASTPFPTQAQDFPAVPTNAGSMQVIEIAGTQTAIALFGTPQGDQGQIDSSGVFVTYTPDPNATPTPDLQVEATQTPLSAVATPLPNITTIPASTTKPLDYELKKGEFPYCIARRFNVDPDELLALNGLSKSQSYYSPGKVLKIPQAGKAFPGERALLRHPVTYTVLSDETVYSIACKFGDVDPIAIANQNGLQPPYTLTIGSQITIP